MVYGYARVSTNLQANDGNSLELQGFLLVEAGAKEIFSDVISGNKDARPQFIQMVRQLKEGDTVIVTKLDRLARSVVQGIHIVEDFNTRGVRLHVLNIGIIDSSPTGKLIRNILLSFSEFEREIIMQRTQEGKALAKKNNPNYREGRPRKYTEKQLNHALELLETHSCKEVARVTGISEATIARAKRKRVRCEKY